MEDILEIETVEKKLPDEFGVIDFKYGDFQTNFETPIDSYNFWEEAEQQANRSLFKLKKLNPKLSFNFDLRSMTTSPEKQRAGLIAHIAKKSPSVDTEKLFAILETNIAAITTTGPDNNHPNPFLKFPIDSDFIKVFISSVIEAYNK